jgi:hypothetical protein
MPAGDQQPSGVSVERKPITSLLNRLPAMLSTRKAASMKQAASCHFGGARPSGPQRLVRTTFSRGALREAHVGGEVVQPSEIEPLTQQRKASRDSSAR